MFVKMINLISRDFDLDLFRKYLPKRGTPEKYSAAFVYVLMVFLLLLANNIFSGNFLKTASRISFNFMTVEYNLFCFSDENWHTL